MFVVMAALIKGTFYAGSLIGRKEINSYGVEKEF